MSALERALSKDNILGIEQHHDGLVVVRFWAPWCASCRAMEGHMNRLLSEYDGSISGYSLNVDRNRELAEALQVKYLPEMMILKSGREVGRIVGELPYRELEQELMAYAEFEVDEVSHSARLMLMP